jgi:hypothetical protein
VANPNINQFNERVRVMNQANSRHLTMTAAEARLLHSEIFDLLGRMDQAQTQLNNQLTQQDFIRGEMDGGRWD